MNGPQQTACLAKGYTINRYTSKYTSIYSKYTSKYTSKSQNPKYSMILLEKNFSDDFSCKIKVKLWEH